jgi:hypothetical protein
LPFDNFRGIRSNAKFFDKGLEANAHENLKHLEPDRDLLSPELIEQYTQAAINLVLRGVLHQEK